MFREVLEQIIKQRKITQKSIYDVTGIHANRISEYLSGKRDMTSSTLWTIIEAMEEISPGAKEEVLIRLGKTKEELEISYLINRMDSQELGETLHLIAQTLEQKQFQESNKSCRQLAEIS